MQKEKQLVPKLRFPEFEEKWISVKLGEASEMKAGKFVKADDILNKNGKNLYSCYGGNGLRGYTYSYTHKGKYSLIGRQGALCGNINLVSGWFHATEHAVVVNHSEDFNTEFIFYILKNLKLNRYATGQAQPGLSISNIECISFCHPSIPEQQKIANFLSAVDTRIQDLEKKKELLEQYKKGITQKIFNQEIRFKDDNGKAFPEWVYKKGNSLFASVSNKDHNSDLPILAVTQDQGAIPRDLIDYNIGVTPKSVSSYKIVEKGDFIISLRSFQGGIEYSDYRGICSPAYIILRPKLEVDRDFYKYYFKTSSYIIELNRKLEGIRDGKMISYKYFSEIKLPLPSKEEQKKIANFLSAVDQRINLVNQQIEHTKTYKKGLLQQMFV